MASPMTDKPPKSENNKKSDYRLNPKTETAAERAKRNSQVHAEEFILLGHDHGSYYYLPTGSGQVIELRPEQHVEGRLIELAGRQFWEQHYGGQNGVDWRAAQNSLIRRQQAVGIYDPSRLRGCGAWWDGDHAIVHIGDRLIKNGKELPLNSPSPHIYERAIPYRLNYADPLSAAEARKLLDICDLISWDRPISGRYLAGWLAIAPICGALRWRPHVWITAAAESGKSWIFSYIINQIIGDIAVAGQHDTTEASLRQSLNSDARPIIFDEAESSDKHSQLRMANVLRLARAATTDDNPPIRKGSPDGSVSLWYIRAAFLFSSISYGVTDKADARRITPLGITKDNDPKRFERLSAAVAATLNDRYADRFMARSIAMIPTIRENARVFSAEASRVLNSQGAGDQIGALLAGAYSLFSDLPITPKDAAAYISRQDWSEAKSSSDDTDESHCLARLLQHILRFPTKHGPLDRSVAELMYFASEQKQDDILSPQVAAEILGRHGLRGDPDSLVVSVSHTGVAGILKDTPWSRNWARTLRRIKGAENTSGTVPFGATRSRGIEIPWPKTPTMDD